MIYNLILILFKIIIHVVFKFAGIIVDKELTKLIEDTYAFNVQCHNDDINQRVIEDDSQFIGDALTFNK